ncbi:MAG TPA: hypothetical protein VGL73_12980, partial [Caulobacteraceae bacterium]
IPPNQPYALDPNQPVASVGVEGSGLGVFGGGAGVAMQGLDHDPGILAQDYSQGSVSAKPANPFQPRPANAPIASDPGAASAPTPPSSPWNLPLGGLRMLGGWAPSFGMSAGLSQNLGAFKDTSITGSLGLPDPPIGLLGTYNQSGYGGAVFVGSSPGAKLGASYTILDGPVGYIPYEIWSKLLTLDPSGDF